MFHMEHPRIVLFCDVFLRINYFSKKECTGRTRLMREEFRPKKRTKSASEIHEEN